MIYDKEPMAVLYDIVKDVEDENLKLYKAGYDGDANSEPDSYAILRTSISDKARIYGDGVSVVRSADCEINLISKGIASKTTSMHNKNIKKIQNVLEANDIEFIGSNLGYDRSMKCSEYSFAFRVNYYE